MEPLDFIRCPALNSIPKKKLQEAISHIDDTQESIQNKHIRKLALNRYAESNLPIAYWNLKMEKDFQGDPRLLSKYNEYTTDIKKSYTNGVSICFASSHGRGKTFAITSILKCASLKGYSCLYATLSDIVNVLTYGTPEDKYNARRELLMVDFLAIDELDVRFFNQSEGANELFSKSFEIIIRGRLQNKLPTLMATNSPNIKENFLHTFKESLGSLLNSLNIFYILGEDFRKIDKESK